MWLCCPARFRSLRLRLRHQEALSELLMEVEAVVPYSRGDLLSRVHELGACDREEFTDAGTLLNVSVPYLPVDVCLSVPVCIS